MRTVNALSSSYIDHMSMTRMWHAVCEVLRPWCFPVRVICSNYSYPAQSASRATDQQLLEMNGHSGYERTEQADFSCLDSRAIRTVPPPWLKDCRVQLSLDPGRR